jgi:hypothetical protein
VTDSRLVDCNGETTFECMPSFGNGKHRSESIRMETFEATIIAKGAPVKTSDGHRVMCAIAVSRDYGLVRFYPLDVLDEVRVWSQIEVVARRSNKDNRRESWRVTKSVHISDIKDRDARIDLLDACVLHSGTKDPIKYQNENQASICVVKPHGYVGVALEPRDKDDHCVHDPEETWVYTQDEMPFKPYITWTSVQEGKHKSHVVAQEVYVGMLNNSSSPMRVFENMRVGDPDYQHWLVLGNLKDRRNVWVVPHLHRFKKTDMRTRSSLLTSNGSGDAWPYLTQEAINAKDAGPQMMLPFITSFTE